MNSDLSNCDFYNTSFKHKHNYMCLLRAISIAKRNIDIAMNILTSDELNKALIDAHKRGIYVRIICETKHLSTEVLEATEFRINECHVHFVRRSSIASHKFCIIDGPSEYYKNINLKKFDFSLNTIAIIGTTIWTVRNAFDDFSNVAITPLYQLVCKYQEDFDTMWKKYKKYR